MLLIKNAELYSPYKRGKKDILVAGGEIVAIEDKLELGLPGLEVIDAEGEIVHPGFIDGHVHAIGGGGESGMLSRVPPLTERKIAEAGVTTIVGLLGTDGFTRTVRDLVAKVKGYKEWGLSAYCLTGSYQVPTVTITGDAANDLVWIDEVIGCKIAVADHRCSFPTTEEIIRLAGNLRIAALATKKAGIVHLHVGADKMGISQLFEIADHYPIPLKHFYPTHMEGHMDQSREWLKRGGHIDLTCHNDTDKKAIELLTSFPDDVTLSTDSNGSFPKWNADRTDVVGMGAGSIKELKHYVDLMIKDGFDRTAAYKAVTVNPAKALSFKKKGELKVGNDADIVIKDGEKIRTVISRGELLVKEGIAKESMYEGV